MSEPSTLIGLFVGGRGLRMGGVDKGNLRLKTGQRVIERLLAVARQALPGAAVVLVGNAGAYADLGLSPLSDEPAGAGPIGGLRALLLHARATGCASVIVLACDLPFISAALIRRLATEEPSAVFLAPREGELWHTLTARYASSCLEPLEQALDAGERALQRLVARLASGAQQLSLTTDELAALSDWDTPEDLPG